MLNAYIMSLYGILVYHISITKISQEGKTFHLIDQKGTVGSIKLVYYYGLIE